MSIQNYDDYVQRHNAAHAAFRAVYVQMYPPPTFTPPPVSRRLLQKIALAAQVITASIVSAAHTIPLMLTLTPLPEFLMLIVALASFIMLETTVILYAYMRASLRAQHHSIHALLAAGGLLTALVLLSANIYSAVQAVVSIPPFVDITIAVLVGAAAPLLALVSGDALGMMSVQDARQLASARQRYEAQVQDWEEQLRKAWNVQKTSWRIPKPADTADAQRQLSDPVHTVRPLSTGLSGQSGQNGQSGHKGARDPDAARRAHQHFVEHPEDLQLSVRAAADKLAIGKSTAAAVMRALRRNQE